MKVHAVCSMVFAAALVLMPLHGAHGFPIGVSIHGGLGKAYYSMEELNGYINELRLDLDANLSDLSGGTNVMLQGRVWFFERIGITATYEHFWGESEIATSGSPIVFKAPGNVYSIGGILTAISIPRVMDFNIGVNYCYGNSVYGTNEDYARRLEEFTGNSDGYAIYAEAMTNFVPPFKFGLMLGYRGLEISNFEDRYGDISYFDDENVAPIVIDYSGIFLYITAGVGL